jgi:rhodanese-related sulfurtransferase
MGAEVSKEEEGVEPQRIAELVAGGEAELVDVRTAEEYEAGHAAGARHIPFDELASRSGEINNERSLVLYCRGGGRSASAAQAFVASGRPALSMAGGIERWVERGLPIEPDNGRVVHASGLPD